MFDQNELNQNLGQTNIIPDKSLINSDPKVSTVNNSEINNPWLKQANTTEQVSYDSVATQGDGIFSATKDISVSGKAVDSYQQANQIYSQTPPTANYGDIYGRKKINFEKISIFLLGLVLIILVIVIIYFTYNYFFFQNSIEEIENQEIVVTENNQNETITDSIVSGTDNSPQTQIVTNLEKDSDGDGLTDIEELKLGTNPYSADTDSDGLTDWAEIKIYKTDPLNPDSDGDGFKDGEEVINGYDPARGGGARLFEVPQ